MMTLYAGSVGSGFADDELPLVREKLSRHIRKDSPFRKALKSDTNITWVDPVFVCEVKFSEWTPEGLMRQPVFLGFREDVDARQIRREIPVSKAGIGRYAVPESSDKFLEVSGKTLKLNLNKYYWPGEGIQRRHYRLLQASGSFILPHLIDRPESLHRFPDGINGRVFHKDMSDVPSGLKQNTWNQIFLRAGGIFFARMRRPGVHGQSGHNRDKSLDFQGRQT